MFKIYMDQTKIPLYKGMKCYFDVPFIGSFEEKLNYYYIIKPELNRYKLCIYDKVLFSTMNGGCDMGPDFIHDRYQADEYSIDTDTELNQFLNQLFQEDLVYLINKLITKFKQQQKE